LRSDWEGDSETLAGGRSRGPTPSGGGRGRRGGGGRRAGRGRGGSVRSAGTDLARAREAGLSDGELMEVLAHVSLKTFTNAAAIPAQTEMASPTQPRLPAA